MADHSFVATDDGSQDHITTEHEWQSDSALKVADANAAHMDAVRDFANAPKNYPSAIDHVLSKTPRAIPVGPREHGAGASATPYRITPSLDPRNIEAIDGYEDFQVDLRVAHNALSSAHVGLEQIANARTQAEKNLAWNDYQKLLIVGGAAEKKVDSILQLFDKANTRLSKLADGLERELTQPLASSAMGGFNVEIRARLERMKKEDRDAAISEAVRSGNEMIAAAVLGAPAMLTGVDPLRHQMWTRQWHEARSPDTVRKLAAVRKAIDVVLERAQLVTPQSELAMRGTFKKLKALRTADSEAQKALLMSTPDDPTV